jgi:hypothetical protein
LILKSFHARCELASWKFQNANYLSHSTRHRVKKIHGTCDIFLLFKHLDLVLFGVEKLSKKALKYKEVTDMRHTFKCTHARVGLGYALLL